MTERIGWLQVSDFHFQATGDPLSQTVAVNALIDDVRDRIGDRTRPSFVAVTGDVAFSGLEEEYDAARPFLNRLADASQVAPARFYFVPGNHDVDRSKNWLAYVGACTVLTSQVEVDRLLGGSNLAPLLDRQRAFWDFVHGFTDGQARSSMVNGLGYAAPVRVGRHVIALLGLNSAWLCGRDGEEMGLLIGERQVIEGLALTSAFADPLFQIAIAHHPLDWTQEWDQGPCRTRLFGACDVFHRGHLHQPDVSLAGGPNAPCLMIAAGSSHATRFYGNSYNWVEVDLATGDCSVSSYRYDPALGAYVAWSELTGKIELRGSLPGSASEIADAIGRVVPDALPYAGYMAGLLLRQKEEVPIADQSQVTFVVPAVAREFVGDAVLPVEQFLGLRNLLRLYPEGVELETRIAEHRYAIAGLFGYLQGLGPLERQVSDRLASSAPEVGRVTRPTELPHTVAFLEELQQGGQWHVLEIQAEALLGSRDARVARVAKRLLAEALMHSDETAKREVAVRITAEILEEAETTVDEYLLAAASAEVVGEDARAIEHITAALDRWPSHPALLTHARGLATRTGSTELRAKIKVKTDDPDD